MAIQDHGYKIRYTTIHLQYKQETQELSPLLFDATYFGKRRDKLGLIVAKDTVLKEPIAYNFIETETKEVYRDLLAQI